MSANPQRKPTRSLGTWEVMVAGVALVVAATTLVSDFNGYFSLGGAFAVALVLGFLINLLLGMFHFTGDHGILAGGLALGIWSFVGIEFACSLAEEVKAPRKSIPRGIVAGLVVILATSLVMGLGVTGTAPLGTWQQAVQGPLGMQGEAPQLAVGRMMFGETGYLLMALSSVAATLGSFVVLFAAMPRMIHSICRDLSVFGPLSKPLGRLHSRFKTPVNATLFTSILFIIPAWVNGVVIDWVYSAAYAWIILYMIFHLLALANRWLHPTAAGALSGRWFSLMAVTGVLATLTGLYYAFAGSHLAYGGRALIVISAALILTAASFLAQRERKVPSRRFPAQVEVKNGVLNFSNSILCPNETEVCHEQI